MKKIFAIVLTLVLALSTAALAENVTITVGASPTPHAEILNKAAEILANQGIDLKVVEYLDYVQPNFAVEDGSLDANYFQHVKYLGEFNEENDTHLVIVDRVHYEPFGIYAGKVSSLDELEDGAQIAIPNDGTNEARALFLLEAQGLIKMADGVGQTATKQDIAENPHNFDILEIEAAQVPLSLDSVAIGVINGNYALGANLDIADALAVEDGSSEVIQQNYANVLAVKDGNENDEAILALIEVLKSDEIKAFIEENYDGAVVPLF